MFQIMNFRTPDVLFGNDTVNEVGKKAKELGAKNVLLITGPHIAKTGMADRVISLLEEASLKVELNIQSKKTPEPTTDIADETAQVAHEKNADVVIGIGGGSIMDVAKIAAAMQTNEGSSSDYLGKEKIKNKGLPTIMIPTTSGTGAEITKHAILLDLETNVKKAVASTKLLPDVAIVDPKLTLSCPASVTASSGLDAFIHAAEPFVSKNANPLTDNISLNAVNLITRWLAPAYNDGDNLEARYYMSMGSLMAGLVLNNAGTSLVHALSYPIGGEYHVPHGISLSVLLSSCFKYIIPAKPKKFVQLAEAMGENVENLPDRKAAKLSIEAIDYLVDSIGLPSKLRDLDIEDESKIDQWAEEAHKEQRLLSRCVRTLSIKDIKKIYRDAF